jgi:PIN domain nuclease of toxin-antitoxin system
MAAYLLDSHTLLWALGQPDALGTQARTVIEDRAEELYVSSVTAWEIATKWRLGKLPYVDAVVAGYERHVHRLAVIELPVTSAHALLAGTLGWEHPDPFDRMLAAQAMLEGLTLITKDPAFADLPQLPVLW